MRQSRLHLEEDSFDFATIFARLLVHYGVQDVFGGNPSVGDALVVAHHPDENIRDAVLWLDKVNNNIDHYYLIYKVLLQISASSP